MKTKGILRIQKLVGLMGLFGSVCLGQVDTIPSGEILYNGIALPSEWPPRWSATTQEGRIRRVPYLEERPEVVPIDIGRQLFVDNFLIEGTNLKPTFHLPEYHPANPVLTIDKRWEKQGKAPFAAVFSDGVWYDPAEKLFKMWYMCGLFAGTAYAYSQDGLHWEKPSLDAAPGTNIIDRRHRDSNTVWLDGEETDPQRRWKMFTSTKRAGRSGWFLSVTGSADGIHWSPPLAETPAIGDRSTVFYNPFRRKWVYSIRDSGPRGRSRRYREHEDAVAGAAWEKSDTYLWVHSDRLDPNNPNPTFEDIEPQLYNFDAAAYESLLIGLFAIWQGPNNSECNRRGYQKRNELLLGYSRDGFHWHRPDRRVFIGATEKPGHWRWGNVQSAGGGCLVVGDKLYFYFCGRALCDAFWDGNGSTGVAVLRRDGFCSLDAGTKEGTVTTRCLRFGGKYLFVNVDCREGRCLVEVLDRAGKVIAPLSKEKCLPLSVDSTLQQVSWQGAKDLSRLAGQPVRFKFYLRRGALYSFWVSPDRSGASHGYVAAGGPGFTGGRDTAGRDAYEAAGKISGP